MAQSVELLLDAATDGAVRDQWTALAAAGLPSEDRSERSEESRRHHGPHVTLYAADHLSPAVDATLPALVAELDLSLVVGPTVVFGPRRGRCILVRLVVATLELLRLQAAVAEACAADPDGQFGPGRWVPHVTLARRVPTDQVAACLGVLGEGVLRSRVTACRRWDGAAKQAWTL